METRNFLRLKCVGEDGKADFDIDRPSDKKLKVVEGKMATGAEWIAERGKPREEKETYEKQARERKENTIDKRRTFWREHVAELKTSID